MIFPGTDYQVYVTNGVTADSLTKDKCSEEIAPISMTGEPVAVLSNSLVSGMLWTASISWTSVEISSTAMTTREKIGPDTEAGRVVSCAGQKIRFIDRCYLVPVCITVI